MESPTTTTPAEAVQNWESQYSGNMETLDSDQENIGTADDELEQSIGGSTLNYGPILTASKQLGADVATAQALPAIPDATAEADWKTELSDLATAASDYLQGFTDLATGTRMTV